MAELSWPFKIASSDAKAKWIMAKWRQQIGLATFVMAQFIPLSEGFLLFKFIKYLWNSSFQLYKILWNIRNEGK
jgi:hypothetical protein